MPRRKSRAIIFAAVLALSIGAAAAYVAAAALRSGADGDGFAGPAPVRNEPHVVFQNVAARGGNTYARVALAPLDKPGRTRMTTRLSCERVYFAAARGLCLASRQGPLQTGYKVTITGPDFKRRHNFRLTGIPSRARISPDGRYGATTAFVTGHSYASDNFSTQTVLIDMARGKVLADLEKDFTVIRNGKADQGDRLQLLGCDVRRHDRRFYAHPETGDTTYLLEGDVRSRRARVLHENVECPSISPDNTRLAYKKWLGDRWRLHVLDLATMKETPLAEERPVDDQVEWLDDDHVLYGLRPDTWVVPADGRGAPRKFLSKALSPAVVRASARGHHRVVASRPDVPRRRSSCRPATRTGWVGETMETVG